MEPETILSTATEVHERKAKFTVSIPMAILVAAAMVSGSVLYVGGGGATALFPAKAQQTAQPDNAQPTPVVIKDPSTLFTTADPMIGNPKAKVTIVEFSDFQCPFCRAFWNDTYAQIKKLYIDTGKVRFVTRAYPLPFHPAARPAALASLCAKEQGKFWEYRDKTFGEQEKQGQATITFGVPELKTWAAAVGLNMTQFNACLDGQKYASQVDADTAAGNAAGVSGTPTFYINGLQVVGAQPFSEFKQVIDAAL
jgi:protein-disulfide isomerase